MLEDNLFKTQDLLHTLKSILLKSKNCFTAALMPCNRQIAVLSDDECTAEDVGSEARGDLVCLQPRPKKSPVPSAVRARLGKLRNALCGCARHARRSSASSCFKQFHGEGMERVFQLVLKLHKLSKQDSDCQADCAKTSFEFNIDPESYQNPNALSDLKTLMQSQCMPLADR